MGLSADVIPSILQDFLVTTTGTAQLGGPIRKGFKRKITRVHSTALPFIGGEDLVVEVFQGDDVLNTRRRFMRISLERGSPDFIDRTDNLQAPLFTLRPDERPLNIVPVPGDIEGNKIFVKSDTGDPIDVSISFYDERA